MRITMNKSNSNGHVLQRNLLSNLVLEQLMDWIMDGKLHMGEKLNPDELASKLGVSSMPIREALNTLEKMGLAESIPYAGTRLVKLTKEDVSEIYMIRKALEPLAARQACAVIGEETVAELERIHREYKQVVRQETILAKQVYQLNREFHFTLYGACGLERLCFMIESLWDILSFFKLIYGQKFIRDEKSREDMILEHESYLDAVKSRDGKLLFRLLSGNLDKRSRDIPYDLEAYFDSGDK